MKKVMGYIMVVGLILCLTPARGGDPVWKIDKDGVFLDVEWQRLQNMRDHVAMSGRAVDMVLEWGLDSERRLQGKRVARWPQLKIQEGKNSLVCLEEAFEMGEEAIPLVHDVPLVPGQVVEIGFDGIFTVHSRHQEGVYTTRRIFPASSASVIIDLVDVVNKGVSPVTVTIPHWKNERQAKQNGVKGNIVIEEFIIGAGEYTMSPGEMRKYAVIRSARQEDSSVPYLDDPEVEYDARMSFLSEMKNALILETPDTVLNTLFYFSKIRAAESVFCAGKGGILSSGGGSRGLTVAWSDDQAQYTAPFFPYLGNKVALEGAMNVYRRYHEQWKDSSVAPPAGANGEGKPPRLLEGDRGDAAMIASGLGRFLLANGDAAGVRELYSLLEKCLSYCEGRKKDTSVIASDRDDLNARKSDGEANLRTNMLYYDALVSASCLSGEMEEKGQSDAEKAIKLKKDIQEVFETKIHGWKTYKYTDASANESLHYAIAYPLISGYEECKEDSVKALINNRLWMPQGIRALESNNAPLRGRYSLLALQGIITAGYQDLALPYLQNYSGIHLLGGHVPYVCDNSRRAGEQAPAESTLYCRLFIEGMFGIRPIGFRTFTCTPRIPSLWERMRLKNIKAFGSCFNMEVIRLEKGKIRLVVSDYRDNILLDGVQDEGTPFDIPLPL